MIEKIEKRIFIVGVPRSGTTLLRMMLDSHSKVYCPPESPWINGRNTSHTPNILDLNNYMINNKWGALNTMDGISEQDILKNTRVYIDTIMAKALHAKSKTIWAEKTPENIVSVNLLSKVFPNAKFIHIIRDPRDVALSTVKAPWRKLNYKKAKRLWNNYYNALKRWKNWNNEFFNTVDSNKIEYISIKYEDLVENPEVVLDKIFKYLELELEESVFNPYCYKHDEIKDPNDLGVSTFKSKQSIEKNAVYKWQSNMSKIKKILTKKYLKKELEMFGY